MGGIPFYLLLSFEGEGQELIEDGIYFLVELEQAHNDLLLVLLLSTLSQCYVVVLNANFFTS